MLFYHLARQITIPLWQIVLDLGQYKRTMYKYAFNVATRLSIVLSCYSYASRIYDFHRCYEYYRYIMILVFILPILCGSSRVLPWEWVRSLAIKF